MRKNVEVGVIKSVKKKDVKSGKVKKDEEKEKKKK
jgi:hypothetical protein